MRLSGETVLRAQAGDLQAVDQVLSHYHQRIAGTVARLVGRHEDVDDVIQEVYVRLHQSLPTLREPDALDTWVFRLTRSVVYDYLRRRRRAIEVRMSDLRRTQVRVAVRSASVERHWRAGLHSEVQNVTTLLLGRLSEEDRALLTLRELEGLSAKELGTMLACSENAIGVRLHRARRRALSAYQRINGGMGGPARLSS